MADKKVEVKSKLRRYMSGVVVNIIDSTTVKVRVERKFPHPKYGKIIKSHKTYLADLGKNTVEKGDNVTIAEIKPISKKKTWEIINKAESK